MEEEEGGRFCVRMEEVEEGGWVVAKPAMGFTETNDGQQGQVPAVVADLIHSLGGQRQRIIEDEKLSARQKRMLLDENRKAFIVATGGKVKSTENVVYAILVFGGVVLVILALLTAFTGLPKEITLSFVGTVLGGVIATIAQKLGKI